MMSVAITITGFVPAFVQLLSRRTQGLRRSGRSTIAGEAVYDVSHPENDAAPPPFRSSAERILPRDRWIEDARWPPCCRLASARRSESRGGASRRASPRHRSSSTPPLIKTNRFISALEGLDSPEQEPRGTRGFSSLRAPRPRSCPSTGSPPALRHWRGTPDRRKLNLLKINRLTRRSLAPSP